MPMILFVVAFVAQGGQRVNEFRRCWFSPILNQFTIADPFTSSIKVSQSVQAGIY